MNQKEMVELVQQHHPSKGVVEVNKALNRASDTFCADTEIIEISFIDGTVAGQRYYSLDADIVKVLRVEINDVIIPRLVGLPAIEDDEIATSDANALSTPTTSSNNRYWFIDGDRIGIVEKATNAISRDDKTSEYQSCSIAGTKNLRVYAIVLASSFTETDLATDSSGPVSELPVQFHEGLTYKAISDLYKYPPNIDINLAQLFESDYLKIVNRAKKYAKSHRQRGGVITPHTF